MVVDKKYGVLLLVQLNLIVFLVGYMCYPVFQVTCVTYVISYATTLCNMCNTCFIMFSLTYVKICYMMVRLNAEHGEVRVVRDGEKRPKLINKVNCVRSKNSY
ncbi:hypothetical protein HanXRQr2_Chr08g0341881 [Helianthus annuus]|uniref:Uncharacterized protein n=1 Tax=Helianthus annuus TaxID=4232 RepID=A0A9K3NCR0_HELAN|nr:hypothetical protein HanXRQr2_Chr08g0341881 [Helianthus annuus]